LVVFLPAIFTCAYLVNETLAAAMGLLFVVGRLMYFRGYTDPEKSRSLGFGLGLIANTVMILATLYQMGIAAVG
jgi:glutathione S-transferase